MTKTFLLLPLLGLGLLTACAPSGTAGSSDEIKQLRADVDALKLEVFGDPLAKCEGDKVLSDISAYADSMANLPDADLESEAWHKSNGLRKEVTTTESGLQYTVVQPGHKDGPKPVGGELIKVNYHGTFIDGKTFDSAYDRGEPIEFPANGVIQGWVEAMGDMTACEARTLYVPGKLAYGDKGRGTIPPNATLIFNVQLLGIGSGGHNH